MLKTIENKLTSNPFYKLNEIDYFWYYTNYTDNELLEIVNFIYDKIDKFQAEPISDLNLNRSIKAIEDFYSNIPEKTYYVMDKIEGVERFVFKKGSLKKTIQSNKSKWLREILKEELNIKGSLVDDPKNNTFKIKYKGNPSEKTLAKVEELRKTVLTDEKWQEMYKKQKKAEKQDKKNWKQLTELMETYKEEKTKYRQKCISKQAKISRWERVLYAIDIEANLRTYEKENNCHIRRTPISSKAKEWKNFKFNQDENGIINNAFIIRKNIPYQLLDIRMHDSIGNMISYPVAYLKPMCPSHYSYIYFSENEVDPFIITSKGYSREELNFQILLVDNMPITNEKKVTKDFRDVFYVTDDSYLEEIEEIESEEDFIDEIQEDKEEGLSFDDIDLEE